MDMSSYEIEKDIFDVIPVEPSLLPDWIEVETYRSPFLKEYRMELRLGRYVMVLGLDEAGQLADVIKRHLEAANANT